MDKAYLEKIQSMTDVELDRELDKVYDMKQQGYDMLGGRDPFGLLAEASIKLCEDSIQVIKEEQKKRRNKI